MNSLLNFAGPASEFAISGAGLGFALGTDRAKSGGGIANCKSLLNVALWQASNASRVALYIVAISKANKNARASFALDKSESLSASREGHKAPVQFPVSSFGYGEHVNLLEIFCERAVTIDPAVGVFTDRCNGFGFVNADLRTSGGNQGVDFVDVHCPGFRVAVPFAAQVGFDVVLDMESVTAEGVSFEYKSSGVFDFQVHLVISLFVIYLLYLSLGYLQ
jgi:hypothetical protein